MPEQPIESWRDKGYNSYMIREKDLVEPEKNNDMSVPSTSIQAGSLVGDFKVSNGSIGSVNFKKDGTGWNLTGESATIASLGLGSEIAIQGWQMTCVFSATDNDTVAWAAGTLTLTDGTSYSIDTGDTGTMAAKTYIYLAAVTSTTVFQVATSFTPGAGKILVGVAQNVADATKYANYQVFGGVGGVGGTFIGADNIAADAITANEILANTITASEISTGLYNLIDQNFPSDTGLVGYWSFDEGKDLKANDISGNGNTGTLQASMTDADWIAGIAGTCLDLDGINDYIDCGLDSSLQNQNLSISYWVKQPATVTYQGIIATADSAGVNGYRTGISNTGLVEVIVGDATTYNVAYGTTVMDDNTWKHVVVIIDASFLYVYVNGVLDGTPVARTKVTTFVNNLMIGCWSDVNSYFTGSLDEVRIYNIALTAKEIYSLYKYPRGTTGVMVPTGRLTSGSIYSKQIDLAVADGTGDTRIAAGKTDFDNTVAGFILGIDDSDSDTPKFYIGDATKYLNWDGTNADVTAFRYLEVYTAGENVTAGNVLCIKPSVTETDVATQDTWVNQAVPTDTHGNDASMWIGGAAGNQFIAYVEFDETAFPAAVYILKAELVLTTYGVQPADGTVTLQTVDAAWDEATLDWDPQPAVTSQVNNWGGEEVANIPTAADTQLSIDITQIARKWKNGDLTFYGFQLVGANAVSSWKFHTSESTAAYRPFIRITTLATSDGKVYKADCSYYSLCRFITGIAIETKSATEAVRVQIAGKNGNQSGLDLGKKCYLGNTGAITQSLINVPRVVEMGQSISTTALHINIDYGPILIESHAGLIDFTGAGKTIIAPDDARWVVVRTADSTPGAAVPELICYRGDSVYGISSSVVWATATNIITITGFDTESHYYFYR